MDDRPDSLPLGDSDTAGRLAQARAALRGLDRAADAGRADAGRRAPLRVLAPMALTRGRVHELAGSARQVLAVLAAAAAAREGGAVLWLRPGWRAETLCPAGMRALAGGDTALLEALIIADAPREGDILWSMEEALRAGCVALVVGEVGTAPDLRQIRRLHLAAAEGAARAGAGSRADSGAGSGSGAPLGLLLAQDRADSRIAGVESRWGFQALPPEMPPEMPSETHPDPAAPFAAHRDNGPRWRLTRLRARDAPPADWVIDPSALPRPKALTQSATPV